ncbi:LysR substrate-binding domain-containing protein [Bordetella bronchiseptica]|nr:LysR substrate-binding domain-containing protein [Bordetella bronchiseptica]KAK60804.1 LysR substrate-binding domain protein [Bordetella bronchiseptica 980-2]AMG86899.1 LysR family transcriptional regulator [Bordetella bronchiseptica]KCV48751.1 LysR substrate-binding domain protein [Bordetella bronchiseptica 3E44]KCV65642.1 LysR substrate-binding domain protein [Bordetella bronchiseptica 980]KDB81278.1 LysR substrate-binding domain protein [Bordetella bronchiseptica D756]
MLNFRQVETFRAVMLTRSMTQAAKDLHTTQPNVSRVIAQLEARIGLRLFERVAGKLVPTREGEVFFRDVEMTFAGLRSLESSAATLRRRGTGHLRISAVPSPALVTVPEAMQLFAERFPDVTVSMHVADSITVCQWTAAGYSDIGVASDIFSSPGIGHHVASEALGVCIVPAGHRLAGMPRALAPADLAGERFLSLSPNDAMRKEIDKVFAAAGDRRILSCESHFAAAICHMVGRGLGVSIANPDVADGFRSLDIAIKPFAPDIRFSTYLVYPSSSPLSLLAQTFCECYEISAGRRRARRQAG